MELKGQFKVMSKKKRDNGLYSYELGDMATFSTLRIALANDLEVDKVLDLSLPVRIKTGKYGSYFELAK